jgi:hypothetical protein
MMCQNIPAGTKIVSQAPKRSQRQSTPMSS